MNTLFRPSYEKEADKHKNWQKDARSVGARKFEIRLFFPLKGIFHVTEIECSLLTVIIYLLLTAKKGHVRKMVFLEILHYVR